MYKPSSRVPTRNLIPKPGKKAQKKVSQDACGGDGHSGRPEGAQWEAGGADLKFESAH